MFDEGGVREKLIIFTEHKAPLRYLEGKIASLLGSDRAVVRIYPKSWVKVEPYGYCVNEIIIFSSNYFTPIAVNAIENMVLLRTILLWGDYGFHQGAKTGQK